MTKRRPKAAPHQPQVRRRSKAIMEHEPDENKPPFLYSAVATIFGVAVIVMLMIGSGTIRW